MNENKIIQKKITVVSSLFSLIAALMLFTNLSYAQNSSLVYPNSNGELEYKTDSKGNRIPDYSVAGYKGGGVPIPDAPVVKTLEPADGDDTQRIVDAIDWVANNIPLDENGIRGAILLKKGVYEVSSRITIGVSGIVIRGEGNCGDGTIVKHTGDQKGYTFFIGQVATGASVDTEIDQDYVPVGATTFKVKDASNIVVGKELYVKVTPSQKWLNHLKMDAYWQANNFILKWFRTVTEVDYVNNMVTIEGGITYPIDIGNGYAASAQVLAYSSAGRNKNIGIEDLILMSDYNRDVKDYNGYFVDENHGSAGIYFSLGVNNWARRVTGYFYWKGLVQAHITSQYITVEDCAMLDGVSTDNAYTHAGSRDYYFSIGGYTSLVQRCYGRNGRHTFVMSGPSGSNVFLDCYAEKEHLSSEPHQNFVYGSMYDNVRTDAEFKLNRAEGEHGQRAASCMLWNVTTDNYRSFEPDVYLDNGPMGLAENWAIGVMNNGSGKGIVTPSPESTYGEASFVESTDRFVKPRSLYLAQLKDRKGEAAVESIVSPEQKISCQAVWDKMIEKYQAIPEFGDPDDLSWLPACGDNVTAVKLSKSTDTRFHYYPNPAENSLNIDIENPERTTVDFYSISGNKVKTVIINDARSVIDISKLLPGVYLLDINSKTIHSKEKLVIN